MVREAKERFSSESYTPPWVRLEHQARYEFAKVLVADRDVVDCACGDGTGSRIFAGAGARRVHAFDVSAETIEHNRAVGSPLNLLFHVASGTSLPVPDHSADVYICLETIEHLDEDRPLLAEAVRVLRPTGTFVCSTPNRTVTNPGRTLHDKPWNRFHVREYDESEFRELLASYFDDVELHGQNALRAGWVSAVERVARRAPGHAVVRFNQLLKVPRLIADRAQRYEVKPLSRDRVPEYLVALCRLPRGSSEMK
jgi:SAM-dependent methyltransferase